nr:hypothetical protein [Tanacetum cinerariifolium]GEW67611.1 hypothetical protein [Tanacetum cinerariifolium]
MEQMLLAKQEEAGVVLTDKRNDFLFDDASRMEEIKELSTNTCLMARIQPENFDSDEGPSYDSIFLSEVQTPSTSYVNTIFAKDTQEQKYPKQPKIINNIVGDDQIDSNIIFDEPNGDVNSGSVEYDNNVQESYVLEQLARNAYKEAEKQQIIVKKYQKLFDSIKRTQTQTQGEINELIENVNQKTYAYADVHAQNQDLLIIISELKAKVKNVEKETWSDDRYEKQTAMVYEKSNSRLVKDYQGMQVHEYMVCSCLYYSSRDSSRCIKAVDCLNLQWIGEKWGFITVGFETRKGVIAAVLVHVVFGYVVAICDTDGK